MSRVAYVNGQYVPHDAASVHVEDRGYQFADGVYEVCEIRDGRIIDERRHLDRLDRSLSELSIRSPFSRKTAGVIMREVIRRNRVRSGLIYLQVTRGVARRDHAFPSVDVPPSVVMTAKSVPTGKGDALAETGISVVTVPENRWDRVDIKSVSLLPNVLAKQKAREAGANEAWFVGEDGYVTEGSSTNAWIVTKQGKVVTRPADHGILRGITRTIVVESLKDQGLELEERAFTVSEAQEAREAFITAASTLVMPVVEIDNRTIGNGHPGTIASNLRTKFHDYAEKSELLAG